MGEGGGEVHVRGGVGGRVGGVGAVDHGHDVAGGVLRRVDGGVWRVRGGGGVEDVLVKEFLHCAGLGGRCGWRPVGGEGSLLH